MDFSSIGFPLKPPGSKDSKFLFSNLLTDELVAITPEKPKSFALQTISSNDLKLSSGDMLRRSGIGGRLWLSEKF